VEHVVRRLMDREGSQRFLVADEVGLGKTLVARGVIAEFIERHWDSVERIDVVYMCSNSALARENLNKLRVGTAGKVIPAARFTLLPQLKKQFDAKLNFISLTPGTAVNTDGTGKFEERIVLHHLLRQRYTEGIWLTNFLQRGVGTERWRQLVKAPLEDVDAELCERFDRALGEERALKRRLRAMQDAYARVDGVAASEASAEAYALIGDLRNLLARTCIDTVEPDLIVLDEFQRFKELLAPAPAEGAAQELSPAAELARQLFSYRTPEDNRVALLLLSATPYKMFTTSDETATEDHHKDFLQTLRFLLDDSEAFERLKGTLDEYRSQLLRAAAGSVHDIGSVRERLEEQLLRVMCRQERVGSTAARDAMVTEAMVLGSLESGDVDQWLGLQKVRAQLRCPEVLELWKSAPYLLNFAKNYEFKRSFEANRSERGLREAFAAHAATYLSEQQIAEYGQVDPGNARLRLLAKETLERGQWKMLWLAPSLPYWPLEGPWADNAHFTKKLLFSSWNVVPDAVSGLLSYEAERLRIEEGRLAGAPPASEPLPEDGTTANASDAATPRFSYKDFYRKRAELLRFALRDGQPAGMTTLALQLPCLRLAELHPLELCDANADVRAKVRERIEPLVAELAGRAGPGTADPAWYWASLLLLEPDQEDLRAFLSQLGNGDSATTTPEHDDADLDEEQAQSRRRGNAGLRAHVERAQRVLSGEEPLGALPEDLTDVLVDFTLGSPAILWARTLEGFGVSSTLRRTLAARLADSVRSLFNEPPVIEMLNRADVPYWRTTLRYAVQGNLQAVLDEYAHQLWEPEAWTGEPADQVAQRVTAQAADVITTKTSRVRPDYFGVHPRKIETLTDGTALRTHFALRYASLRSSGEASDIREDAVRDAFKSPFAPFVLASTSVGQEGLDFHPWCHSVWHWNLPGNPVDLEQREGRVHRYKGHAVRKNVAEKYGGALRSAWQRGQDPWAVLFELAESGRGDGESELIPCWIAPGRHKVQRCVPVLPLSKELERLEQLKRSLAIYRVVFGQPRQEELVRLLAAGGVETGDVDGWVVRLGVG
jgi:hypothetical protein